MIKAEAILNGAPVNANAGRQPDNLTFVRLLAALAVIYGHSFPLTGETAPGYLMNGVQTIAVKAFFVISGYLVTESWLRDQNFIRFASKRLLRIVPALLFLVLFTVFVIGPVFTNLNVYEYFSSGGVVRYFWNVLFYPIYDLPGVFIDNIYPVAVNGSLWTLPVELSMYILMPISLFLVRNSKIGILIFSVFFIIFSLVARKVMHFDAMVFYGTDWLTACDPAPYFFIGVIYRVFNIKRMLNLSVAIVLFVIAPMVAVSPVMSEIALYIVLPYLVLSFGLMKDSSFSFLDKYGDISYGIYLYGFLFQQLASEQLLLARTPIGNTLIAVVPTLVMAWISYKCIERPALSFKPRTRNASPVLVG